MHQPHVTVQDHPGASTISISVVLPVKYRQRERWWLASCAVLDVHAQGETRATAEANLREALLAFIEGCLEMGTLDQVLHASGFTPSPAPEGAPADVETVTVPISLVSTARHVANHAS